MATSVAVKPRTPLTYILPRSQVFESCSRVNFRDLEDLRDCTTATPGLPIGRDLNARSVQSQACHMLTIDSMLPKGHFSVMLGSSASGRTSMVMAKSISA